MKKTAIRLLLAALVLVALVTAFTSCGKSEFTVKVMDGEALVKEYTLEKGATISIPAADLAKTGYDLVGIYTDADMTEELGKDVTATENLTLYAKYRAKTLYILLDKGLGDDEERISVTYGQPYTLSAPTQEGYRFLNYSYMGEVFPLSGTYSYTNSIPVVAKWQKIVYLNVFNGTSTTKVEVAADGSFELPDVADTADNYFAGYLNGTEPFGTYDAASGKWVGTYTGKTDLTITYKWTPVPTYTLTVEGLYGTDAVAPRAYKTGEEFTLPTAPTRDGYRFLGYKVGSDALTLGTGGKATFTWSAATTITAEWEYIPKVTVMNGGAQINTFALPQGGSFTLPAVADTQDNAFLGYNGPAGFTAVWNEDEDCYDCTYTGTADITVTYNWEGIRYITFQSNGTTVAPIRIVEGQNTYTLVTLADTATHYFMGYKKGETPITPVSGTYTYTLSADEQTGDDDVTLIAVFAEKHFVTIYDNHVQVGEPILIGKDGTVTLTALTTADTAKVFNGFHAAGATFTKDGEGYTATGLSRDLSVEAVWYVLPVVTLDTDEGVLTGGASTTVTLRPGANTLPIPVRDGFTFAGWKLGETDFAGTDGAYTLSLTDVPSGTTYYLVAAWTSNDVLGEVEGKNYFKELDGSTGEIIYVFLTGTDNQYLFDNYTLTIDNNDGVVTLNGTGNGFVANKPGTFEMTLRAADGSTRTVHCKVETRVTAFTPGTSTATRNENNFLADENDVKIESFLDAGVSNFIPDIKVEGNRNNQSVAIPYSDIPFTVKVEYKDGNSWVEYTTEGGYTIRDGAITFTDDILIAKENVRLTFTPDYALKSEKAGQTVTVTLKLNDGVNVYTNDELYAAFGNVGVKKINVLRNITASLHRQNVADDAKDAKGNYIHPINSWDHGVYVRTLALGVADECVVNGNYYMIDGGDLPVVNPENPGGSYSGLSAESNEKDTSGLSYRTVNVQIGLFLYYSPSAHTDTQNTTQHLTINDLYITGNNTEDVGAVYGDTNGDGSNDSQTTLVGTNVLRGSMSFHGIVARCTQLTTSKVTIKNTNQGYFLASEGGTNQNRLYTVVNVDRTMVDNVANTGFYAWGQVGISATNSFIGQCGGAAFHYDDLPLNPAYDASSGYLSIADTVEVENYALGTEPWFLAYGMSSSAGLLKGAMPTAIAGVNGLSPIFENLPANEALLTPITPGNMLSDVSGKGQAFNFVAVVSKGGGDNAEWDADTEKGVYVPITTSLGGKPIGLVDTVATIDAVLANSAYCNALAGITNPDTGYDLHTTVQGARAQFAAAPGGNFYYNCFGGRLMTKASAGTLGTVTLIVNLFE